jgi:hypothetical protein
MTASAIKVRPHNSASALFLFGFLALSISVNVFTYIKILPRIFEGYSDQSAFYGGARMLIEGRSDALFDLEKSKEFQSALFNRPGAIIFNHLPYELLFWLPLGFLPYPAAVILWALFNLALLAMVSIILKRQCPTLSRAFYFPGILAMLAFYPVVWCIIQGQESILTLAIYTLSFLAMSKGKPSLAGFLLALALYKPHLVLPLVLLFLVLKRWRFIKGFVLGSTIPIVTSLLMVGFDGLISLARLMYEMGMAGPQPPGQPEFQLMKGMPNIRGLVTLVCADVLSRPMMSALTLILTATLILWAARKLRDTEDLKLAFSIATIVALLSSYHLYIYDYSLLLLPLALLGERQLSQGRKPIAPLASFLLTAPMLLILIVPAQSLFALPVLCLLVADGISRRLSPKPADLRSPSTL